MAVAAMKLVNIVGPLAQFDHVTRTCVVGREIHLEDAFSFLRGNPMLHRMGGENPYLELLRTIKDAAENARLVLSHRDFSLQGVDTQVVSEYVGRFAETVKRLREEREAALKASDENARIIKQLSHIHGVSVDLSEFFSVRYVKFRFGRMPRDVYDNLYLKLGDRDDCYYFPTSVERDFVYGLYLTTTESEGEVDAFFLSLRFERIRLPERAHGDPETAKRDLAGEISAFESVAEQKSEDLAAFIGSERETFLTYYSMVEFLSETYDIRRYAAATDASFFLYGWVPEREIAGLEHVMKTIPDITYVIDDPDPKRGDSPPVKLENPRIFRPFEPFVEMYGRPSYGEIDPTPFMAITYTLLYGIMFGDVGHGLLLLVAGFLMWKLKGMWLGRCLIYTGVSGTAFGFVYGSVFGFEELLPYHGFKVLATGENTNLTLQTAVYVGIALILLSMLFNIINGFKQKDYEKALFAPNGIVGVVLYVSVLLLVLPMLNFLTVDVVSTPFVLFGVVLPLAIIVCRHPLGKLMAKDPDWRPKSLADFLLENLFELIEVLLAYVVNTISFLRVGIFALSHAGLMMVVFLLAGEPLNPVVVVIGNLAIAGIEGLLVGIQVLRLEFYELFGRFLAAEGRPFEPFQILESPGDR